MINPVKSFLTHGPQNPIGARSWHVVTGAPLKPIPAFLKGAVTFS